MIKEELQLLRDIRIHRIIGVSDNGRRISIRCPLPNHRDNTPSFILNPDNSFKCFGCGKKGKGFDRFLYELRLFV